MSGLLTAIFGIYAIIVFASMKLFDPHARQLFVGYLSVASLISMFASPLFIIVSSYDIFAILVLILKFYVLFLYLHVYNNIFVLEFGDSNKERRIHAILSVPIDLFDEPFLLHIWNVQA